MFRPDPALTAQYKEALAAHASLKWEFREVLIAATVKKAGRDEWDQVKLYDLIVRNAEHLPTARHMGLYEQRIRIDTLKALPKRTPAQNTALETLLDDGLDEITDPRISIRDLEKIRLVTGDDPLGIVSSAQG